MRVRTAKLLLLSLLTITLAIPAFAERERHQSYISYDDGGTVVRSGDEGRELDAHRNLPIYPGDEIITARRGRAEVRLSDGNILGIDRTTALRFRSILDSYEGESNETVAELRHGKVAVHRTDLGRDHVRLDTENASYVAEREAIYSVETDSRGRDRVIVFDGSVEVRTPARSTRLRQGESATVDGDGVYDLVGDQRTAADDFERWFLRRAERFDGYNSRYVDRRLGYWADDLDEHGRWVHVTGIGWSWRPYVAVGWRPYYNGYWHHSRAGTLIWVSYDPWAWGTHHYGRWAFDPGYGWVWVPGGGYSPAWVYWAYGSNYVGWAPAGWWDCYRPYYGWAYNPYRNAYSHHGFGFYGRVRVNEFDLRPWTFVDSAGLISNRVDRAALATDAIKQRLSRSRDGYATISGGPARFTREEFRDPAEAIRRRSIGSRDGRNTGAETGAPPVDLTPFVRRDPEVGGAIRDRIISRRGGGGGGTDVANGGTNSGTTRTIGGVAPIGGGSAAPIGRGGVAPIGGGSVAPVAGGTEARRSGGTAGRVSRGGGNDPVRVIGETPRDNTPSDDTAREAPARNWRDRVGERGGAIDRPAAVPPPTATPTETTAPSAREGRNQSWRDRVRSDNDAPRSSGSGSTPSTDRSTSSGSSDVPRRVIDRIGGARVVPREDNSGTTRERTRDSGTTRDRSSGSSSGSSARESSGSRGSSGGGSSTRSSDGGNSGGGSARSSGGSSSRGSESDGGGGGRIKRDQ
jgi:hypothetical protein